MPAKRRPRTWVSPLPATYLHRTLARLLPTPDQLDHMPVAELLHVKQQRDELIALIEADPARFFIPHAHGGQRAFLEHMEPATVVSLFVAGNKGGKTAAGAIKTNERMLGRALWGLETRGDLRWPTPARGVVYAEDFDSHNDITLPNIHAWLPKDCIERINRNSAGHVTSIDYTNGSHLRFQTYEQGVDKSEGKDWNVIWFDEPPPRDVYIAARRGLVATAGVCFITATLVKESWIYDEREQAHVACFEGDIDDNAWLDARARAAFLGTLTEEERLARKSGKPAALSGRVYKTFVDGPPYVIPDGPLPERAPVILVIDPHERRPPHCLYLYVTPQHELICFDWLLAGMGSGGVLSDIFNDLRDKHDEYGMQPQFVLMDPNRGLSTQMGGSCWKDEFEAHGYDVWLADDDQKKGHSIVRDYLDPKTPRLFFMERCGGKNGPIWQMLRYAWDDKKRRFEMNPSEKVKNFNKDFPDCVRYACVADLNYDELRRETAVIRWAPRPTTDSGRRPIHAVV